MNEEGYFERKQAGIPEHLYLLLLLYFLRYLDQKTAEGLYQSSSQAATCYYLPTNCSKI